MPLDPLSSDAIVELLRELVSIPSVNPTIAPDEGEGEARIAAFCRDWLTARGLRAWVDEAAPGRHNAVAEGGAGGGPTLVFCAHLDTVSTAGMTIPPFEPRVESGRLYGRGSYDMKGGAAACMAAAGALHAAGWPGTVRLALVADEEYASVGADDFVRRYPTADGCILTEPSEGRLILAHKGFVWAEIEMRGRAAHGSRWDLGQSAIAAMGQVLVGLDRFDREELRDRTHPLLGPASVHPALIEGGAGLSTYAPSCLLKVERRTLPGEPTDRVLEELRALAPGADVRLIYDRPPLVCDREAPIARAVRASITQVAGAEPQDGGVAYWMDAALFAAAGIPTVDYGPSGAGAHEAVEWVDLESVVTTARVLYQGAVAFGK